MPCHNPGTRDSSFGFPNPSLSIRCYTITEPRDFLHKDYAPKSKPITPGRFGMKNQLLDIYNLLLGPLIYV